MRQDPNTVTKLLQAIGNGDATAQGRLFTALYEELRARARNLAGNEGRRLTLQATALVHEAYLRLLGGTDAKFVDRNHFLACASRAMRHILVDHARRPHSVANSEARLSALVAAYEEEVHDMDKFGMAMAELERLDPEIVTAIEMRFFGGASETEIAEHLGMPLRTLQRRWRAAKALIRKCCDDA